MIGAKVLVVGGGAIGGITAAKMTPALERVTVLDANAEHVARMRDPGLVYEERGAEHTVRVEAVTAAADLDGEYDFGLIGVKAPFHRAALEPLVATGRVRAFASLGNGLIQDSLEQIVGAGNLLACLVEWAGLNAGPGHLIRDTTGPMVVGELDGSVRDRTRLLAQCLEAVDAVRVSTNIRGQIWSKLLVNSTFTGLSAITGLRYAAAAESAGAVVFGLWAEGVAVAEALGVDLEPVLDADPRELLGERREAALARMMAVAGNSKPSMLQDLEHGRGTEVDVINGGVARHGREQGVPTPLNDGIVALVHAIERGERTPDPANARDL
jgi:2-dehydropantoate 2-reductase